MRYKYDFHIHSALSPCALDEMTPNNIVNMSFVNDLDIIAVTDHNSAKNVNSVIEVAKATGLVVLPGMEVESREEIHVICLFANVEDVYKMQDYVYQHLPNRKNKPKVLGHQLILDTEDEVIEEEEKLLSFASSIPFENILSYCWQLGGIAYPAHIDRPSYSVISNLGILPETEHMGYLEISQYASYDEYKEKYLDYLIIQSSDSHELGFVGICNRYLDIPIPDNQKLTSQMVIKFLRNNCI